MDIAVLAWSALVQQLGVTQDSLQEANTFLL